MEEHKFFEPCSLEWLRCGRQPAWAADGNGTLRIADLFGGCGGLSLGVVEGCRAQQIAVEISLAVDADKDALAVYSRNLGTLCRRAECSRIENLFGGKLGAPCSIAERRLAKSVGRVDLLVAGPPCQGHS